MEETVKASGALGVAQLEADAGLLRLWKYCLDVNPFDYLQDVIDRLATHPHSRIAELLRA
jgi:hypothetical protein